MSLIKWIYSCKLFVSLIVKEDEMGRACSTNGGRELHVGYWWENQKEKDH
jgi:hypothetical protein